MLQCSAHWSAVGLGWTDVILTQSSWRNGRGHLVELHMTDERVCDFTKRWRARVGENNITQEKRTDLQDIKRQEIVSLCPVRIFRGWPLKWLFKTTPQDTTVWPISGSHDGVNELNKRNKRLNHTHTHISAGALSSLWVRLIDCIPRQHLAKSTSEGILPS